MAKEKATITLDRSKLDEARAAVGARSASETIDIALTQLIRRTRLVRDVEAYTRSPVTPEELGTTAAEPNWEALADDTDWEALWPEEE